MTTSRAGRARAGEADHDEAIAAERREAARLLLAHPLLIATGPHGDRFPMVRRHAEALTAMFAQHLGYRLVVEAGFARLTKAGLPRGAGRGLTRGNGARFEPRHYTYLTLALSVLVTAGDQLLLSQLVAGLRTAAVDAGIELADPDRQRERRALAAALVQLVDWKVLSEVEGTVLAYADDVRQDALLTVDRDIARSLVAGPVRTSDTAEELVTAAAEPGPGGLRHAVRRLVVENPVVYLDDLTPDERGWLRRAQRREQRMLYERFGLDLEIRAEGVLAVDPADATSDIAFPGVGTVAQAALLIAGQLVERLRPADAGHPSAGARLVVGVPVPDAMLDVVVTQVIEQYAGPAGWARAYVENPPALRDAACDLLVATGLLARAEEIPRGARDPVLSPAGSSPAGSSSTGFFFDSPAERGLDAIGESDDEYEYAYESGDDGEANQEADTDDAVDWQPERRLTSADATGRRVTDTSGARGAAASGYVLLAAAARFLPRPGARRTPRPRRPGHPRSTR